VAGHLKGQWEKFEVADTSRHSLQCAATTEGASDLVFRYLVAVTGDENARGVSRDADVALSYQQQLIVVDFLCLSNKTIKKCREILIPSQLLF